MTTTPLSRPDVDPSAGRDRTWPDLLGRLIRGEHATSADTAWAMDQVMTGNASAAQAVALAVALRAKGETAEELRGLADTMLAHARRVSITVAALDIVGTGGDQAHTVNISTMSTLVAAAAGAPVIKHGNRAASSQCGTADVLEALGVAIELSPAAVARCVAEIGVGFCFAPAFHPAVRHVAAARREIGVPTTFNFLGPLSNPAQPEAMLIGCADRRMAPLLAAVLAGRGQRALVVRGDDGLDEITTTTTTSVWIADAGEVHETGIDPRVLGVRPADPRELRGGEVSVNAEAVRLLLAGRTGAVRDAVVLNAAAALAVFDGVNGDLTDAIARAHPRAEEAIDSGRAAELLVRWVSLSTSLADV